MSSPPITDPDGQQALDAAKSALAQIWEMVTTNATLKWVIVVIVVAIVLSVAVEALGKTMRMVFAIGAFAAAAWICWYLYTSLA